MYTIIEVANTHGGNQDYLFSLIDLFAEFDFGYGIKFQPIGADELATPDFEWYPVYQKLQFSETQWSLIIEKASQTKDVWLDIFDDYGCEILAQHINQVHGIKLQPSVLFNHNVLDFIANLKLTGKKLVVNIAAHDENEIKSLLSDLERKFLEPEIMLEVGFQGYPTQLTDSGLGKIAHIKQAFGKKVVFADHVDRNSEYAIWLPAMAIAAGADVVEKHVLLDLDSTEYDHYSSVDIEQFRELDGICKNICKTMSSPFLNKREKEYLRKTIASPIAARTIPKRHLVSISQDLNFRRSGKSGITAKRINELQEGFHILAVDKKEGEHFQIQDFKKANIAVIVAGRLKSTRLPKKRVLKIGGLSSVELCLKNACKFENINHVVLASSNLEEDAVLADHTYAEWVIFHQGDPDDVIHRYLGIINKLSIDVIIRVTADMPFIDNEICQILLRSHFQSGADYTAANEAAAGTNLEIINASALRKIKEHFPKADYSEYMTWYFLNNREQFRINQIDLPEELIRDYRLTLDYQEDLDMFRKVAEHFGGNEYNLRQIYEFLDSHPEVVSINKHLTLKYKTDQELINTLNRVTKINN